MDKKILEYEKLLLNFQRLHKSKDIFPTFIEISGYPRFENVASNILSFYFDTNQKHGLKDLLLKSLLECTDDFEENGLPLETLNVSREFGIAERKRIDIVIECADFCVSIENKIFHWLHNDLELYQQEVDNKFTNKNNYHIVLSIKKEEVTGNFKNITYAQFFDVLKANIGYYAIDGSNTYIIFLLDFIKTIENHYKVEDINEDMFRFLQDNSELINQLQTEKVKLQNALQRLVGQVVQQVQCEVKYDKQWIFQKYVIVYDFIINGAPIAVDINFQFDRLVMDIFGRGDNNFNILNNLEIIKNNSLQRNHRGYVIFDRNIYFFKINTVELAAEISHYLNQIKI